MADSLARGGTLFVEDFDHFVIEAIGVTFNVCDRSVVCRNCLGPPALCLADLRQAFVAVDLVRILFQQFLAEAFRFVKATRVDLIHDSVRQFVQVLNISQNVFHDVRYETYTMESFFASLGESRFAGRGLLSRPPTRCPYHPNLPPHWNKHGSYERYGVGSERIHVPRFECKIADRTFSLLPDALLPYQHLTTATILAWLADTLLAGRGAAATARTFSAARTTVRRVRTKFRETVKILRLPGQNGALAPADFLRRIAGLGVEATAGLFAAWKEFEPKHSLMGMHPR